MLPDTEKHIDRIEAQVEKMAEMLQEVRISIGVLKEREDEQAANMATKADVAAVRRDLSYIKEHDVEQDKAIAAAREQVGSITKPFVKILLTIATTVATTLILSFLSSKLH
jgi:deoxyribodipyrimidine photolyase